MSSLEDVESYDDLSHSQWIAVATKLGGLKNVLALLRDEVRVELKEALLKFFDKNGRRIPPRELKSAVCDANIDFYFSQPSLKDIYNYADRFGRWQSVFRQESPFSAETFREQAQALLEQLEGNERLRNLMRGIHLPLILSQLPKKFDYGKLLEKIYLSAVERAYLKEFPDRKFVNPQKGKLDRKVSIVAGSRHDQLIEKLRMGPIVAIYFPNPLQGFSINASREQMETLPENLALAGGFDTATALAMYPEVLARDFYTPGLDLAAYFWRSAGCSLGFEAYDGRLLFRYSDDLAKARGLCSAGLLFLG